MTASELQSLETRLLRLFDGAVASGDRVAQAAINGVREIVLNGKLTYPRASAMVRALEGKPAGGKPATVDPRTIPVVATLPPAGPPGPAVVAQGIFGALPWWGWALGAVGLVGVTWLWMRDEGGNG